MQAFVTENTVIEQSNYLNKDCTNRAVKKNNAEGYK